MDLTQQQKITLGNHIRGNAAVNGDLTNLDAIAAWYNADASPDFWVFRSVVSREEVAMAIELDDVANMTDADGAKLTRFFDMRPGGFFGELASERAGFDDILSVAAADDSQQKVAALWSELASEVEKVFADTSGGNGAARATAALRTVTGDLTVTDVRDALELTAA